MQPQNSKPQIPVVTIALFNVFLSITVLSPPVRARSLFSQNQGWGDRNASSSIDFIANWLKTFKDDGSPPPQTTTSTGTHALDRIYFEDPFEGDGRPGGNTGQGSRGNCLIVAPHLTALMPATNIGKTVDGHPTFWFYVPNETSSAINATFILLDEDQKPVLEEPISIPLSGTPGLVSVTLPETAEKLEIDRTYHWFFEIECDADNPSENPRVDGWVERVDPIPGIEPDDYIAYADNGIWYNALTPLARMRQQNPQNPTLQRDWEDLLKAVGLESLADVAISD